MLAKIVAKEWSVAATERYIDELLAGAREDGGKRTFLMKDVRLFLNSVNHSLALMKQGGVNAGMEQRETEDALILTISIPKGSV